MLTIIRQKKSQLIIPRKNKNNLIQTSHSISHGIAPDNRFISLLSQVMNLPNQKLGWIAIVFFFFYPIVINSFLFVRVSASKSDFITIESRQHNLGQREAAAFE